MKNSTTKILMRNRFRAACVVIFLTKLRFSPRIAIAKKIYERIEEIENFDLNHFNSAPKIRSALYYSFINCHCSQSVRSNWEIFHYIKLGWKWLNDIFWQHFIHWSIYSLMRNENQYFIFEIVLRNDIPIVDMTTVTFCVDILGLNI